MEIHILLMQLALIFLAARLLGEVAVHLGMPSVVGELVAGIVIGPTLLGLVALSPAIELLAEIGVVLLLFEVGLDTDIKRLFSAGSRAVLVAIGGIVFPFVIGVGISHQVLGLTRLVAFFIGGTLTATSLGITLRILRDINRQSSTEAQIITGAAIIDDIVGILLLSVLYEFAKNGELSVASAGIDLLATSIFLVVVPLVVKRIVVVLEKWEKKSEIPGLIPSMIVFLVLISAKLAHVIGAPALLGGFSVGIACSKNFMKSSISFSKLIEEKMDSIVLLFTPIFFVAIGLSLNLKEVSWTSSFVWSMTIYLSIGAIIGKLLAAFVFKGESLAKRMVIGLSMVPRGEMGLIFASVGLAAGVFTKDVYTSLILVIVVTTLIAPCFLKLFCNKKAKS